MTHEQVTRHWDAIVAFHDGKPIEMREPGCVNWYPTPAPEFLPNWEYREVEKPRKQRVTTEAALDGYCRAVQKALRIYCEEVGE